MTSEPRRRRKSSTFNKELSAKNRASKRRTQQIAVAFGFLAVALTATVTTTTSAKAGLCEGDFGQSPCIVPEISALEGTAALAVIAAMLLLAWERRRRSV